MGPLNELYKIGTPRRYDEGPMTPAAPASPAQGLPLAVQELQAALVAERAARALLEAAVRQRDEFLGVASHELRTPLTALQLDVSSFVRGRRAQEGTPDQPRLDRMESQIRKLDGLIEQLLDVSRIVLRRLTLDPAEVDAASVIDEVVARFQEFAAGPVSVLGAGPLFGCWDPLRLEQVATNLISNALKYGAGRPVTVLLEADEQVLTLAVRDQGIGIAEEDQARIFERFFRTSAAGNRPGLGLGLWITREIVAAHGGTISVQSRPGQGSSFVVRLPRRPGALPGQAPGPA
jgi:signal transduction histidine kinase